MIVILVCDVCHCKDPLSLFSHTTPTHGATVRMVIMHIRGMESSWFLAQGSRCSWDCHHVQLSHALYCAWLVPSAGVLHNWLYVWLVLWGAPPWSGPGCRSVGLLLEGERCWVFASGLAVTAQTGWTCSGELTKSLVSHTAGMVSSHLVVSTGK